MVNVGIFHTWSLWENMGKATFFCLGRNWRVFFSTWSKPPPKKLILMDKSDANQGRWRNASKKNPAGVRSFFEGISSISMNSVLTKCSKIEDISLQTWQHWSYLQFSSRQICEYFWTRSILEQPPCFVPWTPLGADKKATVLCSNVPFRRHSAVTCLTTNWNQLRMNDKFPKSEEKEPKKNIMAHLRLAWFP